MSSQHKNTQIMQPTATNINEFNMSKTIDDK